MKKEMVEELRRHQSGGGKDSLGLQQPQGPRFARPSCSCEKACTRASFLSVLARGAFLSLAVLFSRASSLPASPPHCFYPSLPFQIWAFLKRIRVLEAPVHSTGPSKPSPSQRYKGNPPNIELRMAAPSANLSSFPPPPPFYKLFTSADLEVPPPPLPQGKFTLFGLEFDPVRI
jgi:hypothetical protein